MRINKIANRSQSHRKANKKQNKSPNNITYKEGNKSNKKKAPEIQPTFGLMLMARDNLQTALTVFFKPKSYRLPTVFRKKSHKDAMNKLMNYNPYYKNEIWC